MFADFSRFKFLISHPKLSLNSSRVILVCFQKLKKRQCLFIQMGLLFCLEVVRLIVVFVRRPLFSWKLESEKWLNLCGEEKRKQILSSKRHCCEVLQDPQNTTFVIWVSCYQIFLVSQCVRLTNLVAHCCMVLIKFFQRHQNQTSAEKLSTCDHHPWWRVCGKSWEKRLCRLLLQDIQGRKVMYQFRVKRMLCLIFTPQRCVRNFLSYS